MNVDNKIKIFYSWQNDSDNKTNRNFIEKCLKKVIKNLNKNLSLELADRDNIILDKDTKDVPGSPPITDTILKKIDNCTVFVADLSFIGKSDKKLLSNPNVLIEYGYALKAKGNDSIIKIMNTEYGNPEDNDLPFNMRHLKNPICYTLCEEMNTEDKKKQEKILINDLENAIKLILQNTAIKTEKIKEIQPTTSPAMFLKKEEPLGVFSIFNDPEIELYITDKQKLFLRIIPIANERPLKSGKEILNLIQNSELKQMVGTSYSGKNYERNKYGAFVFHRNNSNHINHITQVFKNKEIWGIDAFIINEDFQRNNNSNSVCRVIPSAVIEDVFNSTLLTYMQFAENFLNLKLPLKFIAGLTNVNGYKIWCNRSSGKYGNWGEKTYEDNIIYEGKIYSYTDKPFKILRPFYDKIWDDCGVTRPDIDEFK